MSEHPPNNSSIIIVDQPRHPLLLSSTTTTTATATPPSSLNREYRKGNWTLEETLTLITAKKQDDERRSRSADRQTCKTAELRWKWIENYCWNHGCFRSQNQCNDKWDNLMRDYKKVRDYENRPSSSSEPTKEKPSYWEMEKHDRKERNLPSNLLFQVFQSLHDAVNRKPTHRSPPPDASTALLPPPPPPPPQPPSQPSPPSPLPEDVTVSSETEGSERTESDTKKKRRKGRSLGSSVVRSASMLAQTLMACEEKRDKRHQNVLEMEARKLQLEEDRTQINRQGIAGLLTAVNNLSTAVQSFVSDRTDTR